MFRAVRLNLAFAVSGSKTILSGDRKSMIVNETHLQQFYIFDIFIFVLCLSRVGWNH